MGLKKMRCYIIRTKRKKGDKRNMSFSPEKLFVCTGLSTIPFVTQFLNCSFDSVVRISKEG